ncbi:MAG: type I DNA topoisomerase, partial [bacterium]
MSSTERSESEPKKSKSKIRTAKVRVKGLKSGKYLAIVESPAKEKTISRFLGNEFMVKSSYGHVRDLPADELGVDEQHGFRLDYEILPRARKILPELQKAAAAAEIIYLATDHDREGEAIAWHLVQMLDAEPAKFRRITFHEITKQAITQALESPREVDLRLVNAQQARRVLDRLVGYKLSPLLWQKIKRGLSAGRVQSAAVRLLVERSREIDSFREQEYWSLTAELQKSGGQPVFRVRLMQWKGENVEQTTVMKLFAEDYRFRTTCFGKSEDIAPVVAVLRQGPLLVSRVDARDVRQKPKPPFITSSLQQDCYNKLGFAAERTMRIAQSLYEGVALGGGEPTGLITYMRTDSTAVSRDIQAEAAKFISSAYGKEFLPSEPPVYPTKVKGAQEAHEAIRPTSVLRRPEDIQQFLSAEQFRLYDLIWRRFVSSQMAEAVFATVSVDIACGEPAAGTLVPEKPQCLLRATGRTLKYEGYLKVYREETEEAEDAEEPGSQLPALAAGDRLELTDVETGIHKTSPPPAYNEASLIKTLEKHGIGRPSTYAPIIKTIVDRGYARRPSKDRRLVATELGMLVTDKLKDFFPEILDLSYTASVEGK